MRKPTRRPAVLALLALLATSFFVATSGIASAAESMPMLQWSAPTIHRAVLGVVAGPNGSVTVPCVTQSDTGSDLITYNASGQVIQTLPRDVMVDGVQNCINDPRIDKSGNLYGLPWGKTSRGSWGYGPNLLAYSGNTLKWKYPLQCGSSQSSQYTVGANGNVYATTRLSDGVHLIGLTPEVAAGQTQPAKVLDVNIGSDCSTELFPYKGGILLRGQSSGFAYYSYAGNLLVKPTDNSLWYGKLNADGNMFYHKLISGSYTSASVSVYNPLTGQLTWTTSASTPGANVQAVSLYPLAVGGVAALIKEQKMASNGVPVTPTEYNFTLSVLGANGQKVRSVVLPNADPQGNVFGNTYVVATGDGKLTVVRNFQMKTGISSPTTVPAVAIGVYDPVSDSWPYQQVMSGDLGKAGGPYGYSSEYLQAPADNTLFLIGNCSGNCGSITSNRKLFPVAIAGMGMDYPRSDVLDDPPPTPYVALGDSFSAGEGIPPFEAGTTSTGTNECHRSSLAYPRLIAGTSAKIPPLNLSGFRACSGAVSDNLWSVAQYNEGIQIGRYLNRTTQVVTLTIGGNDVKFGDFAKDCVLFSCDGDTAYNTTVNAISNTLPGKLEATYRAVLDAAPNAKVYVLGYPQVVTNKSVNDPDDSRCSYLHDGVTAWGDARVARSIVTQLNGVISQKVGNVRQMNQSYLRLAYVPVDTGTSPFAGHEVCGTSSTSWFQNLDQALNNAAYVFHPNSFGQEGYATVAATAINAG